MRELGGMVYFASKQSQSLFKIHRFRLLTFVWLNQASEIIAHSGRADAGDLYALADDELMRLVALGRQNALTVIFDRYHRLVFSVASRIVRDAGEAEDVVQTVFLDLFRAAATFDPRKGILKKRGSFSMPITVL